MAPKSTYSRPDCLSIEIPHEGSGTRSGSVDGFGCVIVGAIVGEPAECVSGLLSGSQHGGAFTTLTAMVVFACAAEIPNSAAYRGGIETVTV